MRIYVIFNHDDDEKTIVATYHSDERDQADLVKEVYCDEHNITSFFKFDSQYTIEEHSSTNLKHVL